MSVIQWLMGAKPTVQKTTTLELGGLNPSWFTGPIINPRTKRKITGIPWGHYATFPTGRLWLPGEDEEVDLLNFGRGESFFYDPREFLAAKLASNLNTVIVGEINMQKSGGIKLLIIRGTKIGYRYLVIDPKGEYAPIVGFIPGAKEIRFGKDTDTYLNALDGILDIDTAQIPLVSRLVLIAMATKEKAELEILEHTLVDASIREANEHYGNDTNGLRVGVPTLEDVVWHLDHPSESMAKRMSATVEELGAGSLYHKLRIQIARALSRYTTGDMKGMFHRPTSAGIFSDAPLVVMNCEHLEDAHQAAVVVLLQFLTTNRLGRDQASRQFDEVIVDEGWKLSRDRRFVDTLREGTKLGRTRDIGFTCALHNLADAERSSYGYDAIKGLISDCDFRLIYNQSEGELATSATALGVNNPTLKWLIPQLPPGVALLRPGKKMSPYLVKQWAKPEELPMLETTGINKEA
jgi:type IV secretory pathway VirB4 component